MRVRAGVLSFSLVACSAVLAWTYSGAAQTATTKAAPANLHWVETWGTAETPARIPPARATTAARGAQPPGATSGGATAQGAASIAPTTVQNPAALQNRLATPIPIAPEMAPTSNTAAGGSAPQRRYNLPRAESKFDNQTVRMFFRASIGGSTIRLRFYNAFGAETVKIGAAHVALHARTSGIVPGSDRALTFGGKPTATMYAGQTLVSDPVKLAVPPLGELAVSLYFPEETGAPTYHPLGLQPTYTSGAGDFTSAAEITDPTSVTEAYYYVEGVDVAAPADAAAIVTFGDSITDGDQSTPGANAMWPAILAERLQANAATRNVAVVNEGISGNRILGDNVSGLSRFRLQALDVPGVKWITVLEGINDINGAMRAKAAAAEGRGGELEAFSAEDLIAAYRQMINAAHMHGIKVIGCTLTPYGESSGYKDEGEAIREAANNWIRTSGQFDAVVDFDEVTRDSADPKKFSAAADSPDMLHPGDAGYKMMADAFKVAMFAPRAKVGQ
ncbi:MAG TPA: SGNH/GDSL hydrolase family protein [Candidatus Acidoferrales bacterium]|nr:SGNH/GDSL hydrolase family protein [Candidatus Acidoferrales bacterium]